MLKNFIIKKISAIAPRFYVTLFKVILMANYTKPLITKYSKNTEKYTNRKVENDNIFNSYLWVFGFY